jgi:hypothetical protein
MVDRSQAALYQDFLAICRFSVPLQHATPKQLFRSTAEVKDRVDRSSKVLQDSRRCIMAHGSPLSFDILQSATQVLFSFPISMTVR